MGIMLRDPAHPWAHKVASWLTRPNIKLSLIWPGTEVGDAVDPWIHVNMQCCRRAMSFHAWVSAPRAAWRAGAAGWPQKMAAPLDPLPCTGAHAAQCSAIGPPRTCRCVIWHMPQQYNPTRSIQVLSHKGSKDPQHMLCSVHDAVVMIRPVRATCAPNLLSQYMFAQM